MLRWLIRRRLAAFERTYQYDMSYMRHVLEVDPQAVAHVARLQGMAGYSKGVPKEAWYAAKLVGTVHEDCGPCTQLGVTMAERAGVAPEVLRAILERDVAAMPEPAALGFRFAEAVLAHDPEADAIRAQVVSRWGEPALISLAFAVTAARLFPTLKYAVGHGQSCTRVRVAGKPVAVASPQEA